MARSGVVTMSGRLQMSFKPRGRTCLRGRLSSVAAVVVCLCWWSMTASEVSALTYYYGGSHRGTSGPRSGGRSQGVRKEAGAAGKVAAGDHAGYDKLTAVNPKYALAVGLDVPTRQQPIKVTSVYEDLLDTSLGRRGEPKDQPTSGDGDSGQDGEGVGGRGRVEDAADDTKRDMPTSNGGGIGQDGPALGGEARHVDDERGKGKDKGGSGKGPKESRLPAGIPLPESDNKVEGLDDLDWVVDELEKDKKNGKLPSWTPPAPVGPREREDGFDLEDLQGIVADMNREKEEAKKKGGGSGKGPKESRLPAGIPLPESDKVEGLDDLDWVVDELEKDKKNGKLPSWTPPAPVGPREREGGFDLEDLQGIVADMNREKEEAKKKERGSGENSQEDAKKASGQDPQEAEDKTPSEKNGPRGEEGRNGFLARNPKYALVTGRGGLTSPTTGRVRSRFEY